MIKLVYTIQRRPDVAAEDFYRYWLTQHAPKVVERQAALGAVRYVQSHTREADLNALLQQSRGLEPPYDGITEVWWNSAEDLRAALETPAGRQAMQDLLEDEATFIDFARSLCFITEEHPIFQ